PARCKSRPAFPGCLCGARSERAPELASYLAVEQPLLARPDSQLLLDQLEALALLCSGARQIVGIAENLGNLAPPEAAVHPQREQRLFVRAQSLTQRRELVLSGGSDIGRSSSASLCH